MNKVYFELKGILMKKLKVLTILGFLIIINVLIISNESSAQTYWMSAKAGNWSGTSNVWQKSTDGGTTYVYAGTGYPSTSSDYIEYISHAITLNANVTVCGLWVANSVGSLTINSGNTLVLTQGSSGNQFKIEGTCTNNGIITLNTGIWCYIKNTLTNNGTINNYSTGFYLQQYDVSTYGNITTASAKTFSNAGTINIESGATFTNNGNFYNYISTTVGTVSVSGTLANNSTTFSNKTGSTNATINVYGILQNSQTFSADGTITVFSSGKYQHTATTVVGTIPVCVWNSGSTCEIIGFTSTPMANIPGLNQTFQNFIWNCPNQLSNLILGRDYTTFTVSGNFTIRNCGGYKLYFGYLYSYTVSVGGNFIVEAGGFECWNSSSQTSTINVTGNYTQSAGDAKFITTTGSYSTMTVGGAFTLSGGNFYMNSATATLAATLSVTGIFTVSGGNFYPNNSNTTYPSVINLGNNFVFSSGTFASTKNTNVYFGMSGTQTFTSGGTFSGDIHFIVKNGAILGFATAATALINSDASSEFTIQSGGGMLITHASGISTTASTGCIQVGGTQTYSSSGNYEYSTTVAQVTGNALPITVNNFTKSGSSTTTLTAASLTISGTATWTAGTLNIAAKTLTMNGAIVNTAGTVTCDASSTIAVGGSGATSVLPTITGGTSSLTINRAAGVTMGGALTVVNLTLTNGNLDLGSNSLTLNGELSNSGGNLVIQSTSSLSFGGSGTQITIPSGVTALNSLTINRTNGVVLNSDLTLSGTLTLTSGVFTLGAHTLTLNGLISTTSGTLTGGATSNIIFGGALANTTLPAVSGGLNNLTINRANGITLGSSLTVEGTLTLTTGALTLAASSNMTLNGGYSLTSGSIVGNSTANLIINNSATAITLPTAALTLNSLTINRASGVTLGGNTTVNGGLTLSSGNLNVGSYTLTIYGDVTTTSGALVTTSSSSLGFYGGATPTNYSLPSTVTALTNLIVNRNNGVTMNNSLGVTGTLNLMAGNLIIGANTLTASGTLSRTSGYFYGGTTSNLLVNGSGATTLYLNNGINNLTINRTSGVTLGTSVDVNGVLTLTTGTLTLGANNLVLGSSSTVSGTPSSANMIITNSTGVLRKMFTSTGSFTFPVGTTTYYTPATINFTSGTFGAGAYLDILTVASKHSNNTAGTDYLKRYWTFNQYNISNFTYNVNLQYISPTDVNGTEANIYAGKWDGSLWQLFAQANTSTHQLSGTGATSFSTYTGGSQSAMPVSLSSFTSSALGRDINLKWITSSETNNTGFNIERKTTETEWSKVGFVAGKGTTNELTSYAYTDTKLNTGKYQYRLKQIDNNGNFEYHSLNGEVEIGVPVKYALSQNYPNPFNPSTKIDFAIPLDSRVSVIIYDITGREVSNLINNEFRKAGYYTININASTLSSGIYFYRMTTNKFIETRKMILLK